MPQLGLYSGSSSHQLSRYTEVSSVSLGVPLAQQPNETTYHINSPSTRMEQRVLVRQQGKRAPSCRVNKALQSIAILQASGYQLDAQQQRAIVEDVLKKKIRHRYHQALYTRKKKEATEKNELDIRNLRFTIEVLQKHVEDGTPRAQLKLNHGALAKMYQHQFQCFTSDPTRHNSSASSFLVCILAPQAISDPTHGVEATLQNWREMSENFGEIRLELNALEKPAQGILIGATSIRMTVSESTLRMVFPHLNSDGIGGLRGGEWTTSARKLLGSTFVMCGSVKFYLDDADNRVVRIDTQADMLAPMLQKLGSVKKACQAFEQALVTPEFRLKAKPLEPAS